MIVVGLTGGVGAGKSTVARGLARLGAQVIDADALAREVVARGTPGLAQVVAEFGEGVRAPDGSLDRAALGAVVFADGDRRLALEAITHPLIATRTAELIEGAPADAIVVHDIPLLVELGRGDRYHLVVVVGADAEERVRRLVGERGMPEADARARVAAQASDEQRRAAADVWLDNSGAPADLAERVERLWHERLVPFEANVRAGARARQPEKLVLLSPDATWAAQGARLSARVARAAGSVGAGVEHVGSTSVPGLVAKDVIDLQLAVRSLQDADAIADDLAKAGFPRAVGDWWDTPKPPDTDPAHWLKRLHGGADPGRVVNLHVRELGGPGWRYALLLRDWLRDDAVARDDYDRHKRHLAGIHRSTAVYAAAKEPWFDQVLPRADAWASRTGWQPHVPA